MRTQYNKKGENMKYIPPLNGNEDNKERIYINANPIHGEEGSILSAEAIEHPLREIVNTIKGAGLTPDENDLSQLQQAILVYLQPFEELRLSRIGNLEQGDKILNNQSFIPADGRLVLLANYPELKTKLDNYNLGSIAHDETGLIRAERLGIYMYNEDRTGVYVPEFGGRFLRAWTDGQGIDEGRELGSVQGDAIRNITGEFMLENGISAFFAAKTIGALTVSGHGRKSAPYSVPTPTRGIGLNASLVVPTADENRPQNIALHATLYLGKYMPLQEAI